MSNLAVYGVDPFGAYAGNPQVVLGASPQWQNIVGSPAWQNIVGTLTPQQQHAQLLQHNAIMQQQSLASQQAQLAQSRYAATQPTLHGVDPREQRGFDLYQSQLVSSTTGATMTLTPYTFYRARKMVAGDDAATAGLFYSFITGIFIGQKVQGATTIGTVPVGFYGPGAFNSDIKWDTAQPTIPILINLTSGGVNGGRTVYIKLSGDTVL